MHYVNICKGRHFSLLHHFRHRTKHCSQHFNQANHANPFLTYFHFLFPTKSMQIHCTHLILFCYTAIYRYWPTCMCRHSHSYFSRCNLVFRLFALRSIPNLYHWKDLLLAKLSEYKLDMVWIRGSKIIRVPKSQNFDPGSVDPRDVPLTPPPKVPFTCNLWNRQCQKILVARKQRTLCWLLHVVSDVAAHLADGPTGPPGKCQVARRPSPPLRERVTEEEGVSIWGESAEIKFRM